MTLMPAPGETTADAIAKAASAFDPAEPLRFVQTLGDDDCYLRGPEVGGVLFVVPGIWTGMPPELLATMRVRRACSATGRCRSCDSAINIAKGTVEHAGDCPVADDNLQPKVARWVHKVGLFARGRRIREDPA